MNKYASSIEKEHKVWFAKPLEVEHFNLSFIFITCTSIAIQAPYGFQVSKTIVTHVSFLHFIVKKVSISTPLFGGIHCHRSMHAKWQCKHSDSARGRESNREVWVEVWRQVAGSLKRFSSQQKVVEEVGSKYKVISPITTTIRI